MKSKTTVIPGLGVLESASVNPTTALSTSYNPVSKVVRYATKACIFFMCAFCMTPVVHAQWAWAEQTTGLPTVNTWSVASDGAGNVYIGGSYSYYFPILYLDFGSIDLSVTNAAIEQSFWAKYDRNGHILWVNETDTGLTSVENIVTDRDGNLIVLGGFVSPVMQIGSFILTNPLSFGYGYSQYYLAKISPSGAVLWATSTGCIGTGSSYGSAGVTTPANLAVDSSNNIYVTSSFRAAHLNVGPYTLTNTDPTGATSDIFLAKYTPAGDITWATSVGGSENDFVYGITVSSDNYVYITGNFISPSITFGSSVITNPFYWTLRSTVWPAYKTYIARFSPDGAPLWADAGGGDYGSLGIALSKDNNGNVFLIGSFCDSSITLGGTTLVRAYPPALRGLGHGVVPYLATFLVEYSPSGVVTWAKKLESPNYSCVAAHSIAVASDCQLWAKVIAADTLLIDDKDTLPGVLRSVYIVYNIGGSVAQSTALDGAVSQYQSLITCDDSGNLVTCGNFGTGATFGATTLTGSGIYTAKYLKAPILPSDTLYRHVDTSVCSASSVNLTGPPGYTGYAWSTGADTSAIIVTTPGTYIAVCTGGCGNLAIDTFHVSIGTAPLVTVPPDTLTCAGSTVKLTATEAAGCSYLWNTGQTTVAIVVTTPGAYWLTVTNSAGCSATDTTRVADEQGSGNLADVTPNQTIAYGSSIQLNADSAKLYFWKPDNGSLSDPNVNNPVATPLQTTEYTVYGYNIEGCLDSASVTIYVDSDMNECIPTAFTPNGDGLNDKFGPSCIKFQNLTEFRIYNRWGQQVFYSNNYNNQWDGTFNGVPQELGTYYYQITIARPGAGNLFYKGNVTLIR